MLVPHPGGSVPLDILDCAVLHAVLALQASSAVLLIGPCCPVLHDGSFDRSHKQRVVADSNATYHPFAAVDKT